jgi:hypothetical protein
MGGIKMSKKLYKGKIAYVDNVKLGIKLPGGHYAYIRSYDPKSKTCSVNTIKSIQDNHGNFINAKLLQVKSGLLYPIPIHDTNLSLFSGVSNKPIKNIELKNLKNIGKRTIKTRHKFYIGKYLK